MNRPMEIARPLGFLVIGAAALIVWIALAPAPPSDAPDIPSAAEYERLISQALDDNATNDARTESAPQQQVVNGWVARDLLTIIAKANADLLDAAAATIERAGQSTTDERIPALLAIAVLALVWDGLAPRQTHRQDSDVAAGQLESPA